MSYYGNNTAYPAYGQPQTTDSSSSNQANYSTSQWQSQGSSNNSGQQQQPTNPQQWQQPAQQQQQQSTPQFNQWAAQPQGQQQQQQPAPAASSQSSWMTGGGGSQSSGDAATQAAMAIAASAIATNQFPTKAVTDMTVDFLRGSGANIVPGLESFLLTLRAYFAVDNNYVLHKIQCVLFPFMKKQWHRNPKGYGGPDGSTPMYDLPIADINAPDLYLPSMSLITYTLLSALLYGNAGKFNPEVIPDVTTKCVITQVLEVVLIRVGFYFVMAQHQNNPNIRPVALLDLFAYTGYKYLGLAVNMVLGLMAKHFDIGARMYYIAFLWTASAASYFMLKTMSNAIPTTNMPAADSKRSLLVIVVAASQVATMWFLSQTKFL